MTPGPAATGNVPASFLYSALILFFFGGGDALVRSRPPSSSPALASLLPPRGQLVWGGGGGRAATIIIITSSNLGGWRSARWYRWQEVGSPTFFPLSKKKKKIINNNNNVWWHLLSCPWNSKRCRTPPPQSPNPPWVLILSLVWKEEAVRSCKVSRLSQG